MRVYVNRYVNLPLLKHNPLPLAVDDIKCMFLKNTIKTPTNNVVDFRLSCRLPVDMETYQTQQTAGGIRVRLRARCEFKFKCLLHI